MHFSEFACHVLSKICLYDQKQTLFSNFARFCTPKRCTRVHRLVRKNNPDYVIFFYEDDIHSFQLQIQVPTPPLRGKGVFRVAHPHNPFLGQCPPPGLILFLLFSLMLSVQLYFGRVGPLSGLWINRIRKAENFLIARGVTRMARRGIRLVHGLTKSTLITYFSGMKIDPKYAFLHAFFWICLSCSFQNLSIWPKTDPFFQFCTFLHP